MTHVAEMTLKKYSKKVGKGAVKRGVKKLINFIFRSREENYAKYDVNTAVK